MTNDLRALHHRLLGSDPEHKIVSINFDGVEIPAGQIRHAIRACAVSMNDVKRRTRAGTGTAQGKDTEYVVSGMIGHETRIPLDRFVPVTARPPAGLISLADFARVAVALD